MSQSSGYAYAHGALARTAFDMGEVAGCLRAVRQIIERDCALPTGSLGWAAEMQRRSYGQQLKSWLDEIDYGVKEAEAIGERAAVTDRKYVGAESAQVRNLLRTMGWAPDAAGRFREQPAVAAVHYDATSTTGTAWLPKVLMGAGFLGVGFDAHALRTNPEWRALTREKRRAGRQVNAIHTLRHATDGVGEALRRGLPGDPKSWNVYHDGKGWRAYQSQSAVLSRSTTSVLTQARRFSLAAITAAVVWDLLVIPSDEVLNRVANAWDEIHRMCRQLFGSDLPAIQEAAMAVWDGPAMNAADQRLLGLIYGGHDLADYAKHVSERIGGLIEQLNTLHKAVFWISASTVALLAAHAMLSFIPAARVVAEMLGRTLTSLALVAANLVPALVASQLVGSLKMNVPSRVFPRLGVYGFIPAP
ncbi:hypothetical protein FHU36_006622 [Nonomuraea muscovyensis]|uniref:Uncharacterized protein n=1 Tax=Nonomuraea muscovyensis TaxID=1124761 RepID=A0A7X0C7P3_9ACTN|nr:hypothetical protein [Nonomuraea muscovyensis]MBB6350050.1 hypothetical protein [Nonomuraea muscovyensis]